MTLKNPFPGSTLTDAKSVIDEQLMDFYIRENLEDLDSRTDQSSLSQFKVNGNLSVIPAPLSTNGTEADCCTISLAKKFTRGVLYLRAKGTSGTLEFTARMKKDHNKAVLAITNLYTGATQSVNNAGGSLATQSITRATAQVSTQSISFYLSPASVDSVVPQQTLNSVRINTTGSLLDTNDYLVGDFITFSGMTNPANDGVFAIDEVNPGGAPGVLITNASAVAQPAAAGSFQAHLMSYNLTGAAATSFVVGEKAEMLAHTDANNNGNFEIYKVNDGGNNIVVRNTNNPVVDQPGIAGTIDTLRFSYNYLAAVGSDFIVGEDLTFASHTAGGNDGQLQAVLLNSGGNNIIVYNESGVIQGGVAGTATTNRWIYALPTDPSGAFNVEETMIATSHSSGGNNGTFVVKEINRLATNNLVVFNATGVVQAGVAGTTSHTRRQVDLTADFSDEFAVNFSNVTLDELETGANDGTYLVKEVNRNAGFNLVVEAPAVVDQVNASGAVILDERNLFATNPSFTSTRDFQISTNAVLNDFTVPANSIVLADVVNAPSGTPEDAMLELS